MTFHPGQPVRLLRQPTWQETFIADVECRKLPAGTLGRVLPTPVWVTTSTTFQGWYYVEFPGTDTVQPYAVPPHLLAPVVLSDLDDLPSSDP